MSTRSAVLLALALLALPAPAAAKELGPVKVCGADGCTDVTGRATHAVFEGGPPTAGPTVAEPSFVLRLSILDDRGRAVEALENRWLPGSGLLRGDDGTWMSLRDSQEREFARLTDGIAPHPASAMGRYELAPEPTREPVARASGEEDGDGGGGAGIALAVAAPAAAAIGLAAILARRRRRRRR